MLHTKYKYIAAFLSFAVMLAVPSVASAAVPVECADGYQTTVATADRADSVCADHQSGTAAADSTENANQNSDPGQGAQLDAECNEDSNANGTNLDKEDCGIIGYIITFINVLSALVGTVIVIMIAVGGIQYSMARDDPQAVSTAKNRIQNAIFALVIYLFGFAFLQWLVPGGVF